MSTAVYHASMSSKRFVRLTNQTMRLYVRNADMYPAEFSLPLPVSPKAPMAHLQLSQASAARVPAAPHQPAVTAINPGHCHLYNPRFLHPFSPEHDKGYNPKYQRLHYHCNEAINRCIVEKTPGEKLNQIICCRVQ